jgi:prophage regulatory protein
MPEFLIYPELKAEGVRFSRKHLERLERLGLFPRRVKISARRIGWIKTEVQDWVQARIALRDPPPPPPKKGSKR